MLNIPENNITLQESLYNLRSETQDAFDKAKNLEARWKELEKEQREVYQVSHHLRVANSSEARVTPDLC